MHLGRVPGAVATDIRALAEAALRISVIERTLMSLLSELQLVGGEITRVRSVVEPQQKKVPRIEQTVQTMDQRTAVTERTLLDLKERSTQHRAPPRSRRQWTRCVLKAKDALTGG